MALDLLESENLTVSEFKTAGKYNVEEACNNPMEHMMKSQWKHQVHLLQKVRPSFRKSVKTKSECDITIVKD